MDVIKESWEKGILKKFSSEKNMWGKGKYGIKTEIAKYWILNNNFIIQNHPGKKKNV